MVLKSSPPPLRWWDCKKGDPSRRVSLYRVVQRWESFEINLCTHAVASNSLDPAKEDVKLASTYYVVVVVTWKLGEGGLFKPTQPHIRVGFLTLKGL